MTTLLTWDGVKKQLAGQWPTYMSQAKLASYFVSDDKLLTTFLTVMVQAGEIETNAEEVGAKNAGYRTNNGTESQVINETLDTLVLAWDLIAGLKQRTPEGQKIQATLKKFGKWKPAALKPVASQGPGTGKGGHNLRGKTSYAYMVLSALRDLGGKADVMKVFEKLDDVLPLVQVQKAFSNLGMKERGYVLREPGDGFPAVYSITQAGHDYLARSEKEDTEEEGGTKTVHAKRGTKPPTGRTHLFEVLSILKKVKRPATVHEVVAALADVSPMENKQAGKILTAATTKKYTVRIGDDLPARYQITKTGLAHIKE